MHEYPTLLEVVTNELEYKVNDIIIKGEHDNSKTALTHQKITFRYADEKAPQQLSIVHEINDRKSDSRMMLMNRSVKNCTYRVGDIDRGKDALKFFVTMGLEKVGFNPERKVEILNVEII